VIGTASDGSAWLVLEMKSHSVWVRVDSRHSSAERDPSNTSRYGSVPAGTSRLERKL